MKKWLVVIVSVLMASTLFIAGCGGGGDKKAEGDKKPAAGQKTQIYFASGSPGGVYQILGAGMVKVLNEKVTDYDLVATTPPGMVQSPTMMDSNSAGLGIGMACLFDRAYNGIGEFEGKPHKKLRSVLGMYDNGMVYLTLKDSPLISVSQVADRTFGSPATNITLTNAVMQAYGIDPKRVKVRVMSYQQSSEALIDGVIETSLFTGFPKNGTVDSLASTKGVKFLEMDDAVREKFDKANPKWKCMPTDPGLYTGVVNTKPVYGPTIYTVLYTNSDASEEFIYNATKAIIENVGEIEKIHPAGKDITLETTKRYLENGIMTVDTMHPGAIRYFKEKGIIK